MKGVEGWKMCVCVCLEKHSPDVKLERKQSG